MKANEIFGLAIRILGLWVAYQAIGTVIAAISIFPAMQVRAFVMAGAYCAVAWWLLGGAPLIARRAYPPAETPPATPDV